eukprot:5849878-Alexandrium_andersonii.AAC.1
MLLGAERILKSAGMMLRFLDPLVAEKTLQATLAGGDVRLPGHPSQIGQLRCFLSWALAHRQSLRGLGCGRCCLPLVAGSDSFGRGFCSSDEGVVAIPLLG